MKRRSSSSTQIRCSVAGAFLAASLIFAAAPALADDGWHPGWYHGRYDDDSPGLRLYVAAPPIGTSQPPVSYYRSPPPPAAVYFPPVPSSPPVFDIVLPIHF